MHASAIFTSLLSLIALVAALPLATRDTPTISIQLQTSYGLDPNRTFSNIEVPLATLTPCLINGEPCSLSAMTIISSSSADVDANQVECRGYKDIHGELPDSAPFTVANPAEVSTNLAMEESLLCYILTTGEINGN